MKSGWEIKKLGDYFDITSSKRVFKSEWRNKGVAFYRAREIVKLSQDGFVNNKLFITEKMYEEYAKKFGIPQEGDIMVTGVGTLGICYLVKKKDKFYFKDGNIIWLKKAKEINSRFVEYAFQSKILREQIDNSIGVTVGTYTIIKAKNTKIPIPPMAEQQRIVDILDKAFDAIDKAIANTEQNLQNAKDLFESYLQGVFEKKGDDWKKNKLEEVYDVRDGTHDSPKYQNEGYPLITSKNLKNHKLTYNDVKLISEKDYININKRSKVDKGDVLFAMIGTIGNPVVIIEEPDFAIKNVALFKVGNEQNGFFLKYFLESKQTMEKMMNDAKGSTQKFVGLGYLRSFSIYVPPFEKQQFIVRKLDALRIKTQKLETGYLKELTYLEELKKSILQNAFAGELTN